MNSIQPHMFISDSRLSLVSFLHSNRLKTHLTLRPNLSRLPWCTLAALPKCMLILDRHPGNMTVPNIQAVSFLGMFSALFRLFVLIKRFDTERRWFIYLLGVEKDVDKQNMHLNSTIEPRSVSWYSHLKSLWCWRHFSTHSQSSLIFLVQSTVFQWNSPSVALPWRASDAPTADCTKDRWKAMSSTIVHNV